jgi:uncharacterized membrane protein
MSMDLLEGRSHGVKDYDLERLIMLSDGVFAIAITLSAIDLRLPTHWGDQFADFWRILGPPLRAYAVSFLVIAAYWAGHRRIFSRHNSVNPAMIWLNFLFLALVAMMAPATQMVYGATPSQVLFTLYTGLVGLIGVSQALLFAYGAFLKPDLLKARAPLRFRLVSTVSIAVLPVGFTAMGFGEALFPGAPWRLPLLVVFVAWALLQRRLRGPASATESDVE